jgi:hypothetical protein
MIITESRLKELQAMWNDADSTFDDITEDEFVLLQCCAMDAIISHLKLKNPMAFDGADLQLQ